MNSKVYPLTILLLCFFSSYLFAQKTGPQSLAMLEESPAGSKIIQFIELINHGKEVQEADISSLFSKRLIDKIGSQKLTGFLEEIGMKLSRFHRGKKVKDPKLPLGHFVYQKIDKKGIDYVKDNFKAILNENDYGRPNPSILNQIGYDLLWEKQIDKVIEVL